MANKSNPQAIAKMLENCKNFDNDIKYTGAHDLCNVITTSTEPLDEATEKRICTAFIEHLGNTSVDVKSNAVRCIQRVAPLIRESNLIMILQKLAQEIVTGPVDTVDIFALTIRGIISEAKDETAQNIVTTLNPRLLEGIESRDDPRKEECLEICTELFKRFGLFILRQQSLVNKEALMKAINNQLQGGATVAIRKRASFCMGAFAVVLNAKQLQQLAALLLDRIRTGKNKADTVV